MNDWRQVMDEEYTLLLKNKTWSIVNLPRRCGTIGCQWIYKLNLKLNSNVEHFKACLVTKGYSQEKGIDYQETFAPVVKFNSIRLLLTLTLTHNLKLHQMDV